MSIEIRCYSAEDELLFSYSGKKISDVKIIRQIDPSGLSLPISTADFVLLLENESEYVYSKNQRFEIYLYGNLLLYTVLKDTKKIGKNKRRFYTEDVISILENSDVEPRFAVEESYLWETKDALEGILKGSGINYQTESGWYNNYYTVGFLPKTNRKDALLHLAFVQRCFVDVSGGRTLKIKPFPQEVKVLNSSKISTDSRIEEVGGYGGYSVEYFKYEYPQNVLDSDERSTLRDTVQTGEKGDIDVYFESPVVPHSVSVTGNGSLTYTIDVYAKFTSDGTAKLTGVKYSISSALGVIGTGEKKIKGMTLVHPNNVQSILSSLYSYYKSGQKAYLKIYEGFEKRKNKYGAFKYGKKRYGYNHARQNQLNVGDKISFTLWGEEKIARIEKQTFKLTDGVIVKDTIAQILEE